MSITTQLLKADRLGLSLLASVLLDEDVFTAQPLERASVSGLMEMAIKVDHGDLLFALSQDLETGRIHGGAWAEHLVPGRWGVHTAYRRGSPALECATQGQALIRDAIGGVSLVAWVPESNRAARIFALRMGYRPTGNGEGLTFRRQDDTEERIVEYEDHGMVGITA